MRNMAYAKRTHSLFVFRETEETVHSSVCADDCAVSRINAVKSFWYMRHALGVDKY
jgi:hypothetical protein